jgi:hypothetical protein
MTTVAILRLGTMGRAIAVVDYAPSALNPS